MARPPLPAMQAASYIEGVSARHRRAKEITAMLETLVVILVALWLLGMFTATSMGGLIHVLLVIAVIVVLVRVIRGRSV
jgi:hypothetical protein